MEKTNLVTSLLICVAYALSSMLLTFTNKYIFHEYAFKRVFIILFLQQLIILALLGVLRIFPNATLLKKMQIKELPEISVARLKQLFPVSFLTLANVLCGITAITMVNVPMFLCLRRTVCFFVLVADYISTGNLPKPAISACIGLIVLGTLIASVSDLTYEPLGYLFVAVNNILSTVQMQTVKSMSDTDKKADALSMLFLNSINTMPVLLAISWYVGDFQLLAEALSSNDRLFSFLMTLSASLGVSITYFYLLCSIYNSPMATSVTGNVKDIFLTALSFLAFGDVKINPTLIVGLAFSLVGAVSYSYVRVSAAQNKPKTKKV